MENDKTKNFYKETDNGIYLYVTVKPKASKSEILAVVGLRLKIKLAALPQKGKANKELIQFFSQKLPLPKSKISITQGEISSLKTIFFEGVSKAQLLQMLKMNKN